MKHLTKTEVALVGITILISACKKDNLFSPYLEISFEDLLADVFLNQI